MRPHVLAFGVVPFAWLACVSSSDSPQPAPVDASVADIGTSDTGTQPTSDAAPVVDAPADAPVDAPPDAPADVRPAPVVVTVVGALGPESGVTVVWGSASGDVVTTGTSDASGVVTMDISGTATTTVTALLGSPAAPWLYTITGIEPGDQLVIVDQGSIAGVQGLSAVTLRSVPTPLPAANNGLTFHAGFCNSADQASGFAVPMSISLLYGQNPLACLGVGRLGATYGAAFPALVESNDTANNLLGFVFAKDNAVVNDAGQLDLALDAGTWAQTSTSQTFVKTGVPDAGTAYSSWSTYSEVADGVLLPLPERSLPDGGVLPSDTTVHSTHGGYADFVQTELGFNPESPGLVQQAFAMATRAPVPATGGTTTVDWSPLYTLPSLVGVTVDASVLAQPTITWTTGSGTLAASTAVIVRTSWTVIESDGGISQTGNWTIVSAGTAQSSLQAPKVPAASSAWTPQPGANFVPATVYAIQGGTALPGYAQVRAAASLFYLQNACIFKPMIPPLPAAGTLMVSGYTSGGCG